MARRRNRKREQGLFEIATRSDWKLSAGIAAASLATGAALVAAGVLLALQRSYPDFAGVGLERAVWHLVDQEQARSGILLALLQGLAAADGLRLWLAQQLLPVPGTSAWQLLGWAVVLAEETLFVWSYLLLAHGVLTGVGAHDRGPH